MNTGQVSHIGWLTAAVCALSAPDVFSQTAQQTFQLRGGWNAVYLEVDPQPDQADDLFADLPITAVWALMREARVGIPPECANSDDLSCVSTRDNGWRVWFPPGSPHHVITTLRVIRGGRVYLIEAAQDASLVISGRPNASRTRWREGVNLAGFHVVEDETAAPTFARYLAPSPAHHKARIYEIEPDGNLSPITAPARAHITAGRGYWVTASQDTVYDGPLKIDNRSLRGISLAGGVLEHAIRTENLAADSGSVTISHLRSPSDPSQGSSSLSGSVPLVWFDYGQGAERDLVSQWRPLDGQTWSLRPAGKAGSAKVLRVAVNRAQLAGSAQTDGMVDRHHQAVLQVTDGTGFRRLLPVEAETDDRNGLWVGTVTINKVEWIHELGHAPLLTPTSSEFTFRIIIHKSDQDEYKLLTEATRLWQPDDEANTNGHYILVTPACQEEFANGKIFSPRVSTAAFSFDGDWPLVGDFDTGLTISEPIVVEKGHSLNPLQHSYHPDHECKRRCVGGAKAGNSCEFSTDCPADDAGSNGACAWVGGGCVEVVRDEITFRFDDDGYGCPEWGHSLLGGTYKEEITGLYRDLINVQGGFELRRISDIPTLCDAVNSNGVRGRVSALPIGITE